LENNSSRVFTKRELLRTLRGAPSRARLTLLQSRLSDGAGWLRYSITAIRRRLADTEVAQACREPMRCLPY